MIKLFLYEITDNITDETSFINVDAFQETFKALPGGFSDKLVFQEVEYIDWIETIKTQKKIHYLEFFKKYELVLERNQKVFYFAPKEEDNPLSSPNLIIFTEKTLKTRKVLELFAPVIEKEFISAKVTEDFYYSYLPDSILLTKGEVQKLSQFLTLPDVLNDFIQLFVINWENGKHILQIEF